MRAGIVAVLLVLVVALGVGCGSSGGSSTGVSKENASGFEGSDAAPSEASDSRVPAEDPGPDAAVVVSRCPEAEEVSRAVGFEVKKGDLGEGDCAYFPRDPANSGIGIQVLHPHNAFPNMTSLEAAKQNSRIGGGTAETESTEVNGAQLTSFLKDTPEYGPGTFKSGETVIGHSEAEMMQTCDFFVLGTDGYPASVQAEAQKGGAYSYQGAISQSDLCAWAAAVLELAVAK